MGKNLYTSFIITAITLTLIIIIELSIRVICQAPKGTFYGCFPGGKGPYPENATIDLLWGAIPYTVKTNSSGFRGEEVSKKNPPGRIRILTIGDSVTDGFFVDNSATYPYYLQKLLQKEFQCDVEVINISRGGSSIDGEYAALKKYGLSLCPDIAVLTFVSNDIYDIKGKSRDELIQKEKFVSKLIKRFIQTLVTKTALGEYFYHAKLKIKFSQYNTAKQNLINNDKRYDIDGGASFRENTTLFNSKYMATDGIVLKEPFSDEALALLDNYQFILKKMNNTCLEHNIKLVFVYFPAYPQIYDINSSSRIQNVLNDMCNKMEIPFFDLTTIFREKGKNTVLHLAPIDFHPNPAGNRVIAEGVANYLATHLLSDTFRQM